MFSKYTRQVRTAVLDELSQDYVIGAYMYWLQLLNGNNSLLFYGNCDFKVKHIESRKVGE